MSMRKSLVQSRKLPAQHVETLWEHIYKDNLKVETLCSILMFYLHHRVYPPPVQKSFDVLVIAFTDPKVSKKLRTLLFQIVEEMCLWLSPACISETVRISNSPNVVVGLLPCLLLNKESAPLPINVYERLLSNLTMPGLTQHDRGKVLTFLMSSLPPELQPKLDSQLITWLSYSRPTQTTGSLFRSADVSEMDGSPSLGICTVLTLVSTVTDLHWLSVVCFSHLRRYLLSRRRGSFDPGLLNATLVYCDTLLAQTAKKPSMQVDKQVVSVVLEEVLSLVSAVKKADDSFKGRCQLSVLNIQRSAEQLRLIPLLVSVWQYQLSEGTENGLTERMLSSVIKSDFSHGSISQCVTSVLAKHSCQLSPSLVVFAPNIFKLIATHPSALVEDFLDIVPRMVSDTELVIEVLHCLLDLPVQSASICIHQSPLLVQAGIKVPALVSSKQMIETGYKQVYSHMMRVQTSSGETQALIKQYLQYWMALRPVFSLGLVEVCSQVAPLLLDVFLDSVSGSVEANRLVFPVLLSRVSLLCPIAAYQSAVFEVMLKYVKSVSESQPELLEDGCFINFLSVPINCQLCPELFVTLVEAAGNNINKEPFLESTFETLEALLREILVQENLQDLKLITCICTSLAKLASKNQSLTSRAISTYDKLIKTVQNTSKSDKETIIKTAKDLQRLLKNPRVASVVLCPVTKEDVSMASILKVLFQFLD